MDIPKILKPTDAKNGCRIVSNPDHGLLTRIHRKIFMRGFSSCDSALSRAWWVFDRAFNPIRSDRHDHHSALVLEKMIG